MPFRYHLEGCVEAIQNFDKGLSSYEQVYVGDISTIYGACQNSTKVHIDRDLATLPTIESSSIIMQELKNVSVLLNMQKRNLYTLDK